MNTANKLQIQILFNNEWHDISLPNLKKDNIIRIVQSDGTYLTNAKGGIHDILIKDAYLKDKNWTIESVPYEIPKQSLQELALKANERKNNPNMRTTPNESDLKIVNENLNLVGDAQMQTIQ